MARINDIDEQTLDDILRDAGALKRALRIDSRRDAAWQAVEQRISPAKHTSPVRMLLRIAAVLIPVAFVALFLVQRATTADTFHYATTTQADTFLLPDGSQVVLGKGSQLAFVNGSDSRDASLQGIALFDVRHDEGCPFTVSAGDATVRVLGTTFSVEHWADEDRVRTRVKQGHVAVSALSQSVSLLAGEEATFSHGTLTKMRSATPVVSVDSREMVFHAASLQQVLQELMTCYHGELKGVRMNCRPDSTLITTSFKDQSLASVVEELNMHFDKNLSLRNGYLTISD